MMKWGILATGTMEILELMDQIRKSWGMRFACE